MTFRITKSLLARAGIDPSKYGDDVALFGREIRAHREHMVRVAEDAKLSELVEPNFNDSDGNAEKFTHAVEEWTTAKMNRHQACPAPHIPSPFAEALNADGTPDFEIIDDDAEVARLRFEKKKSELLAEVTAQENDAVNKIVPFGKRRALALREATLLAIDEVERSADADEFLEQQERSRSQEAQVVRWAATQHSAIEDLTAETIDAFKIEPFEAKP